MIEPPIKAAMGVNVDIVCWNVKCELGLFLVCSRLTTAEVCSDG
jgi:hypothetical protein